MRKLKQEKIDDVLIVKKLRVKEMILLFKNTLQVATVNFIE